MAHYAKVTQGIVKQVIVAEAEFFDTFEDDSPGKWIKTSYNTQYGIHKLGGTPLRKNFAGINSIYDLTRDAFYEPQPFASWTLVESSCRWQPPHTAPDDGKFYDWDEVAYQADNSDGWKEIV